MGRFYSQRQGPDETVRAYAVQLRTLMRRARRQDPQICADPDKALRDQFVEGLKDKDVRLELLRRVRRHETLTFAEVKEEALELVEANTRVRGVQVRGASAAEAIDQDASGTATLLPAPGGASPDAISLMRQVEELRRERHGLLEQNHYLSRVAGTLCSEIENLRGRSQAQAGPRQSGGPNPRSQSGSRNNNGYRSSGRNPRRGFTADRRPICYSCNEEGHMSRNCPQVDAPPAAGHQSNPLTPPNSDRLNGTRDSGPGSLNWQAPPAGGDSRRQ
ncbi:uncharacterized protein LOC118406007 [Branchiostoma floridae]|uniref:Uncharacterized protein LOC118406007 n=1 Tax=Branchiostoma floridae TaxID=7739 RepID=A0A9J7HLR9_BRAFL|nr:uncharacterized protein LOC118406007 [Branchiostoma floridae]